jgi:hypothetical protein
MIRRILDTVAQVRKCGLESALSLPQLVVCGSVGNNILLQYIALFEAYVVVHTRIAPYTNN